MNKILKRKLFGTDGIRGKANEFPVNIDMCMKLAHAIVSEKRSCGEKCEVIAIGKDTRISSSMLESALSAAFCSLGVDILLLGILPTPAISILIQQLKLDAGIMITASHNPYYDNGLKVFNFKGEKLKDSEEIILENRILENNFEDMQISSDKIGNVFEDYFSIEKYYKKINDQISFKNNTDKYKLYVDCANGAFSFIAEDLLNELGFNVKSFNDEPNGININDACGVMHPDFLIDKIKNSTTPKIGILFDGDGDRLILIDELARVFDGDKILAILSKIYSSKNDEVVTTIMSSMGLEEYFISQNIKMARTNVGDRYIYEHMQQSPNAKIGGELSGHIIIKEHTYTGDGLFAALKVLEYVVNNNLKLSDLYDIYKSYPIFTKNIKITNKDALDNSIQNIIDSYKKQLEGKGRLVVRASGTEPVIRILIEGKDEKLMHTILNELSHIIGEL